MAVYSFSRFPWVGAHWNSETVWSTVTGSGQHCRRSTRCSTEAGAWMSPKHPAPRISPMGVMGSTLRSGLGSVVTSAFGVGTMLHSILKLRSVSQSVSQSVTWSMGRRVSIVDYLLWVTCGVSLAVALCSTSARSSRRVCHKHGIADEAPSRGVHATGKVLPSHAELR